MTNMLPQTVSGHAQKEDKTGPKRGAFRGTTNHPQEGKTPVLRVLAAYILHTTSVHHAIIVLLHVRTYTCTMYLHTYIAYGMYMIPCIAHVACVVDTLPEHAQKRSCSWCACVALTKHHLGTQDDALLVAVVHYYM